MENFHSERRAELFGKEPHPFTKVATPLPFRFSTTASPLPLIEKSSPRATPATPPVTTPSSQGFYVSTATPSSFSFHYNTDQEDFFREQPPPPVARSTTTPPTTVATPPPTTPTLPPPPPPQTYTTTTESPAFVRELPSRGRDPKSFYVSDYGQKINEIDIDNKVAEERHDHFFIPRWPPSIGTPFRSHHGARSRNSLFNPGPTLASTVISSLKPRPLRLGHHRKYHHHNNHNHHQSTPQFNAANPYARRRLPVEQPPPPPPPPPQSSLRRSSNGDHRYVSFYRGQIGGQSWGYSYRLWCICYSPYCHVLKYYHNNNNTEIQQSLSFNNF